ncbi:MAG: hypothetical protein K9L62_15880 [Vallitaleaceae bacterium]|nr:hypothetical protein [Vallitaleaceae bacterium]
MINVNITSINQIVLEGESLSVGVEVINNYSINKQDVTIELLDFSDTVVDSVTLYPSTETAEFVAGTTENITLNWNMQPDDSGKDYITISSQDESVQELVLGVFSVDSNSSYIESGGNRHIGQITVGAYDRNVADEIKPQLDDILSSVEQDLVNKLEQNL